MSYISQITNALDKEIENVAFLAYFPVAKLEKKLQVVKQQILIAEKNNQLQALDLLKIWEQQISDARLLKKQLEIDDNLDLDMQLSLPEIEAYEMIEKRQELMKQKLLKDNPIEAKSKHKDLF
ncbi:MAG: hypothetical protein V4615_07580 [Bacteroidota bacterium]